MLKAHSWADVSVGDMHVRNPDGSVRQDPYKTFKDRVRKFLCIIPREITVVYYFIYLSIKIMSLIIYQMLSVIMNFEVILFDSS